MTTIYDVAERAGVSTATESAVFNGPRHEVLASVVTPNSHAFAMTP